MINASLDDLIAALQAPRSIDNEAGWSAETLAETLGMDPSGVRRKLNKLKNAGKLRVRQVRRPGLDGRTRIFVLYSLLDDSCPVLAPPSSSVS